MSISYKHTANGVEYTHDRTAQRIGIAVWESQCFNWHARPAFANGIAARLDAIQGQSITVMDKVAELAVEIARCSGDL